LYTFIRKYTVGIPMTQVVRTCKYGCGRELGQFDTKQGKYLEVDGTIHTKERCESLKQLPNGNDLSLEVVLKKLKSIGITLDLELLKNATNGGLK